MPRRSADQVSDSRRAILETAVRTASLHGLEGLTIGRLADELAMSKSGLHGHFGSKEELQLAALETAVEQFMEEVWSAPGGLPPGRARLLAICDAWLDYYRRRALPGGCLLNSASLEFDGRPGRVRDTIAAVFRRLDGGLRHEIAAAQEAGEVPADRDPAQIAFELQALTAAANQAFQLRDDEGVLARARSSIERALSD